MYRRSTKTAILLIAVFIPQEFALRATASSGTTGRCLRGPTGLMFSISPLCYTIHVASKMMIVSEVLQSFFRTVSSEYT